MYDTKIFNKIDKRTDLSFYCLNSSKNFSIYPKCKGLYFVYTSKQLKVNKGCINKVFYDGKVKYDIDYLYKKLLLTNKDNKILYIGESGCVQTRIKQLVQMMYSKAKKTRKGGICLKSLIKYENELKVCYIKSNKITDADQIKEFADNNGFLPFANITF